MNIFGLCNLPDTFGRISEILFAEQLFPSVEQKLFSLNSSFTSPLKRDRCNSGVTDFKSFPLDYCLFTITINKLQIFILSTVGH